MSIVPLYEFYLQKFAKTETLSTLFANPQSRNIIGLRHDVDYNLDIALEMAWLEHDHGCKSTYFLLHTQSYFDEVGFLDRCLQIQDLGHEIGFHNNLITEWILSDNDAAKKLANLLASLRAVGLTIKGTSTHGDKLCYEHQYLNAWIFHESRPTPGSPNLNPEGMTAIDQEEAIVPPNGSELKVSGKSLQLWGISLQEFGLEYQAHQLNFDSYFTDSGGSWRRSQDPLDVDLTYGRHQILVHPIWWAEKKRTIFALSTARSGSTWLANFIDKGTAFKAKHEFTLNHVFSDGHLVEEKNTADGFTGFLEDEASVSRHVQDTKAWLKTFPNDYLEANVYLIHVVDELKKVFPDAEIIHLHRDGRRVIRSLLNRRWYETPEDDRHPALDVPDWESLSQLEKCCWYFRLVNEAIYQYADHAFPLETITADYDGFVRGLNAIGIRITLPKKAHEEYLKTLNPAYTDVVPDFSDWPPEDQATFYRICGEIQNLLGYGQGQVLPISEEPSSPKQVKFNEVIVYDMDFTNTTFRKKPTLKIYACKTQFTKEGLEITVDQNRDSHAHIYFGGGKWHRAKLSDLIPVTPENAYYRINADIMLAADMHVKLFVLMYNKKGDLLEPPYSTTIRQNRTIGLSVKSAPEAVGFTYALYFPKKEGGGTATFKRVAVYKITRG